MLSKPQQNHRELILVLLVLVRVAEGRAVPDDCGW